MSSAPSALEASRVQEIVMKIDELRQKRSREQLSQLEAERLDRLQLELLEKEAYKEAITPATLSELQASRIQEIVMRIDELTQKQYQQPLPKIEAERLHQLQLELITKDFAAYQSLQQNLITRLSSLAIEKEKRYQSYNLNDTTSKQFVAADGPLVKTIQKFNPMWQDSERIIGNEYNTDSSRDNQNKTFRKF